MQWTVLSKLVKWELEMVPAKSITKNIHVHIKNHPDWAHHNAQTLAARWTLNTHDLCTLAYLYVCIYAFYRIIFWLGLMVDLTTRINLFAFALFHFQMFHWFPFWDTFSFEAISCCFISSFLFLFLIFVFWIASNSSCHRINQRMEHVTNEWMHLQNIDITSQEMCLEDVCSCCCNFILL